MRSPVLLLPACALLAACIEDPPPPPLVPPPPAEILHPDEGHLSDPVQLTFGGPNGEPRWSWAGDQIILESGVGPQSCSRLSRISPRSGSPTRTPVAQGRQPAFMPGDKEIVYAGSPKCSKHPDPVTEVLTDPELDLYRAKLDGSSPVRLTETPGFDGEPDVCRKDGSIVFTSMRDSDLDLYRMDAEGHGVRRLTAAVGYDGAAVFDADCAHVVWIAGRPHGKDLEDYKSQLGAHVLHPRHTEVWVANADGTDARQITYLDSAITGVWWHPSQARIVFASNYAAAGPRDVDLWAIDVNGTGLERVTTAAGYDGAPTFSPDGKWLAFTSTRRQHFGEHGTDILLAHWGGEWRHVEERPADHLMGDSAWLAHPEREGRGLGTKGLEDSGAYVERSLKALGLQPAGEDEYRQMFGATTEVSGQVTLTIDGAPVHPSRVRALGFSLSQAVEGPLVLVATNDDFAKMDLKGKIAVVKATGRGAARHAAWLAHGRGAVGLLAVTSQAPLPVPTPEGDEGLTAAFVGADVMGPMLARLGQGKQPIGKLAVTLAPESLQAFNVIGRWPASVPESQKLPGVIVVGAHYDHIGETSPGADDNASGVAALLQVARSLSETKPTLLRDLVLVGFSGEAQGAAGAHAFVRHPPPGLAMKDVMAMINLDMVGRLRDNTLQVFGEDTATQWPDLVAGACSAARIECARATSGGFGATDHTPFYEAGVPVVHLFTGVHGDYGMPTDTTDKLNAAGMAQVAVAAERLARDVSDLSGKLDYQRLAASFESDQPEFKVSLGTIPDRAGPPKGVKGMLLAGVRPGGAADKAGLRRGDLLVRLGDHIIGGVEDVMFVLTGARPGSRMKAVVVRDGREITVDVTFEEVPRGK